MSTRTTHAATLRGRPDHDDAGEAALELAELAAGAYRLRYTTRDAFGAVCERSQELLVAPRAGESDTPFVLPAVLLVEHRQGPECHGARQGSRRQARRLG